MSSSPRQRKRVTFADDTPVSACVSECRRSTQRPRRTNLSAMGGVRPDNKKTIAWHTSMLACKSHLFSLFFSSRRVQISGSVEDYPVPAVTVDTATDVSVVSHAWLMSHPTLRSVNIQPVPPVPPTAVALRAANGSPLNVVGFVVFSLTLGTITHDVEAFVVPSLGPDSILLDNSVVSVFGAVLDWETRCCLFRLLAPLYQQFIVLAIPPPAPLIPPLPLAALTCPSPLSTMMQEELMSAFGNVSILNLDARPLS